MNFKALISYFKIRAFLVYTFELIVHCIPYFANYENVPEVLFVNQERPKLNCEGKCYFKKQLN